MGFSGERTSQAQLELGLADARAARRLAPDAPAKLLAWQLLLREGRRAEAEAVLHDVVQTEPQNYEAWLYLSRTARDPRIVKRAKARVAQLGPAR